MVVLYGIIVFVALLSIELFYWNYNSKENQYKRFEDYQERIRSGK